MRKLINQISVILFTSLLITLFPKNLSSQILTVDIIDSFFGGGGAINLKDLSGNNHVVLQPDLSGNGGFFSVDNGFGDPAFTVNGQTSSSNFNATVSIEGATSTIFNTNEFGDDAVVLPLNAINSFELLNEVGVTNNTDVTHTFTSNFTNITSQTISAPTEGYILAIGTAQLNINHTNGSPTQGEFGVSNISQSLTGFQDIAIGIPNSGTTGFYFQAGSVHGIFEAVVGANTIYLVGRETNGDGISVNDSTLSLIFIPTSYGSISTPFNDDNEESEVRSLTSDNATQEELELINNASIKANEERMLKEINDLKLILENLNDQGNEENKH